MNLAAAESALIKPHERTPRRQRALQAVLRTWPTLSTNWKNEEEAYNAIWEAARKDYGSVAALWLIFTAAGAALSWLIERLLSRLFPDNRSGMMAGDFAAQMDEWSR